MKSVEIYCTNCKKEALLQREPIYDGFTKTGETLSCASCGFAFASEADVSFKAKQSAPTIFTEADRSEKVNAFDEGENRILCCYCAHYVTNPFTQFCSIHKKEVQATDTCSAFEPAEEKTDKTDPF